MITTHPYCRTDQIGKNGKAAVIIYLKKQRSPRTKLTTDFSVDPKYFNNLAGKFKPGAGDSMKMNSRLSEICAEIETIGLDHPNSSVSKKFYGVYFVSSFGKSYCPDFFYILTDVTQKLEI